MTAIAQTRDEARAYYRRAERLLGKLEQEPSSYAVPALLAKMEELATVMEKSEPPRDEEPLQVFSAVPGVRPIWIWAPIVIGTIAWVVVALYATRRYWA